MRGWLGAMVVACGMGVVACQGERPSISPQPPALAEPTTQERGALNALVSELEKLGCEVKWDTFGSNAKVVSIRLEKEGTTDALLTRVGKLKDLKELRLMSASRVTDAGAESLKDLGQLEELTLGEASITDGGLLRLAGLKHLRVLGLGGTKVTDVGLEIVADFKQLRRLSLYDTRVSGTGLASLRGLKDLKSLNLSGCELTDAGWGRLKELKQIDTLGLNRTAISDYGMQVLTGMKQLRWLTLGGGKLSREQCAIEMALPKAIISG